MPGSWLLGAVREHPGAQRKRPGLEVDSCPLFFHLGSVPTFRFLSHRQFLSGIADLRTALPTCSFGGNSCFPGTSLFLS